MIQTPEFFAFPSGHATQAFAVARILQIVSGRKSDSLLDKLLQQQAEFIATNRVIAGVHFPVDSTCGRLVGESLVEYFLHRACSNWAFNTYDFDGSAKDVKDSDLELTHEITQREDKSNLTIRWPDFYKKNDFLPTYLASEKRGIGVPAGNKDLALGWLWDKAKKEW